MTGIVSEPYLIVRETLNEQHQPDGADDLRGRALGSEAAGEALHAEAQDRTGHEDGDRERQLPVQALVDVQEVEEVRRDGGDAHRSRS